MSVCKLALALLASAAVAAATAAGAGAVSPGPVCKTLQAALGGTQIAFRANELDLSGPTGCQYIAAPDAGPWMLSLALNDDTTALGGPAGKARLYCKSVVSTGAGTWYTRAGTGADVSCAGQTKDDVKRMTHGFFARGRWYGELFIVTAPSSGGLEYMRFLLKRVTTTLPK